MKFLYLLVPKCGLAKHSIEFLQFRCLWNASSDGWSFGSSFRDSDHGVDPCRQFKGFWPWFFYFFALVIFRKWHCPQHIVASTLLKPSSWGTLFLIPPTVCTNRISTLPKPRFWSTHVQDPWNMLTNQTFESIVSLLGCRSATTVLQILTFCIVSSSSWRCLVIVWVLIRAHSSTDSDIRRC